MTDFTYYYLNRERTGYHFMLITMGLVNLMMIPNDLRYIQSIPFVVLVIALRVINLLSLLLLYLVWHFNWGNRMYQVFILTLFVPAFALAIMVEFSRPLDYLFGYTFHILFLSFYYFTLPANLPSKIVPSLVLTVFQLWAIWFRRQYDSSARLVITSVFLGLNTFGVINATAMFRLRQAEHRYQTILKDEARFKRALAESTWDAIILCLDDTVVDYNQNLPDLLGLNLGPESGNGSGTDTLRGKALSDILVLPEDAAQALEAGSPVYGTINSATRSVPVEVRKRVVKLDGARYTGILLRDRSQDIIDSLKPVDTDTGSRIRTLPLSEREKQIVSRIVDGHSRFRIANELFISDETVKTHTNHIYRKLGIRSKVDLIKLEMGK